MTASKTENVVIIGSGPAAWTAAIYSARASLAPLVFEGEPVGTDIPGGQLMLTTDIENYPGFPEPIAGAELMAKLKEQAERYGTRVVSELVVEVDLRARPFRITPSGGKQVFAHTIIVATGAKAKWLGLDNELRLALSGGGVSACAVCDGALPAYRNQVLAGRVKSNPKIRILWNKEVADVIGGDAIERLKLADTVTGEQSELEVGG